MVKIVGEENVIVGISGKIKMRVKGKGNEVRIVKETEVEIEERSEGVKIKGGKKEEERWQKE